MVRELTVGKSYNAKFCHMNTVDSEIFPNSYIPIYVVKRYRHFWLVEVTPHKNPVRSQGMSTPYKLTITPHQLLCRDVVVKEIV